MRTRIVKLSGLCLLLILIATSSSFILADRIKDISFNNQYGTGSVSISLAQYSLDASGQIIEARSGTVQPGEQVSYIPVLTSNRADCYVRAKVSIELDDNLVKENVGYKNLFGQSKEWKRVGDYYYYTRVLHNQIPLIIFQGLDIPESWSKDEHCPGGFTVRIKADAIQAANFTPDFESSSPWGSVVIEHEKEYDPTDYCETAMPYNTPNELTVTDGTALESKTRDLFGNFSYFMAGDTFTDILYVNNNSKNRVKLFFRMKNGGGQLGDKTRIKVSCGNKTYYNGKISSMNSRWQKLTSIDAGQSKKLKFTLTLAKESNQEYSVLRDDVIWQFRTTSDEMPSHKVSSVKTGDNTKLLAWCCLFLSVLLLLIQAVRVRRR